MLNYEYPPLGGGAGNANHYLLREFAKQAGVTIDLVTSSVAKSNIERFSEDITIHYLDIGKKGNAHYQTNKDLLSYSYRAYFYAKKLTRNHRFDLVHAFFGIPCGYLARKLKLPYIVSLRGSDVPFYNKRFERLDKLFFQRMSRNIWKHARFVVTNSEGLKQLALKTSPLEKIDVIWNGVDTDAFTPPPKRTTGKKISAVSTGRLIQRKGYQHLIRALEGMNDWDLVLIGDGNMTDELKNLANHLRVDVRFVGKKNRDDVISYLRQADIFVLPSSNEGMSNSLLEAISCGLPVIVTDVGGSRELVKGNGYIVEKENPAALKTALQNYVKNRELLTLHGKASREIALSLSWRNASRQYLDLYNKI